MMMISIKLGARWNWVVKFTPEMTPILFEEEAGLDPAPV
jgi:hypothetical protein